MKKYVVLSDLHVPNHDEKTLKTVGTFITKYKPNVIIVAGDFGDFDSVSAWLLSKPLSREGMRLKNDFDAVTQVSKQIDKWISKKCEKIICLGNHEDRVKRKLEQFPEFSGLFDVSTFFSDLGWTVIPYNVPYSITENLYVTHGSYLTQYPCKRHLDVYGKNMIFGHSHRVQHLVKPLFYKTISAYNIGCLCKMEMEYLKNIPAGWSQGFCTIEVDKSIFSVDLIEIHKHSFIRNGKLFKVEDEL